MASILDEYILDKRVFERCICNCLTKEQMLKIFRKTREEMDVWCGQEYDLPDFSTVYDLVKISAIEKFTDVAVSLGERGNPSALNLISNMLLNNANAGIVKIQFVNSGVTQENEEDKINND